MSAHRVLVRLAHEVLDGARLDPDAFALKEQLKQRAADARLPYDAGAITRALDAAMRQRRQRRG
jgi:hypothetical protein